MLIHLKYFMFEFSFLTNFNDYIKLRNKQITVLYVSNFTIIYSNI